MIQTLFSPDLNRAWLSGLETLQGLMEMEIEPMAWFCVFAITRFAYDIIEEIFLEIESCFVSQNGLEHLTILLLWSLGVRLVCEPLCLASG